MREKGTVTSQLGGLINSIQNQHIFVGRLQGRIPIKARLADIGIYLDNTVCRRNSLSYFFHAMFLLLFGEEWKDGGSFLFPHFTLLERPWKV